MTWIVSDAAVIAARKEAESINLDIKDYQLQRLLDAAAPIIAERVKNLEK